MTARRRRGPARPAGDPQLRYAAERRQGEEVPPEELLAAWGWSGAAGRLRADRRADFLVRAAGLTPGVSCLELGCGTGEFSARLVATGCRLVAVELSPATAAVCGRRLGDRGAVVVGNVETGEGIPEEAYDAVVGVSVLHHVDLDQCLRNTLVARLRPGGRFAFTEPNLANPQVWAERRIGVVGRWRHTTAHETAFRADELRQALSQAGLVVDVCEPFDFLHPSTPKALIGSVRALERRLERTPLRRIAGSIRVAGRRPGDSGGRSPQAAQYPPS